MKITYAPVGAFPSELERLGLIAAYKAAFAGPPYFEHYTDQEVMDDVWTPHVKDGIIILAYDEEKVVGFGCALPLLKSPDDVQSFVTEYIGNGALDIDPTETWYMSELGVLEEYRGHRIGSTLVKHRMLSIDHRGHHRYVFRTAAERSNSIGIYHRIGAADFGYQDMSDSAQVVEQGSQSTTRVYLYGDTDTALAHLS